MGLAVIGESVRHATALVHATPGGRLVVADERGRALVVGDGPGPSVDPCRWRRAVVAALRRNGRGDLGVVRLVGVGGTLRRTDDGVFVDAGRPRQRWFTTGLGPSDVAAFLPSCSLGGLAADGVTATLRPDPELGVTLVGVAAEPLDRLDEFERVCADLAAAVVVHELVSSVPAPNH